MDRGWHSGAGELTDDLFTDWKAEGSERPVGVRGSDFGGGLEEVAAAEDVADVDPEDEVTVVGVAELVFELGDPSVGVDLDGVVELEAVDEEGDPGEGLEVDGAWHLGSAAVDGVEHDGHGLGVEAFGKGEVDAAVGLGARVGVGVVQLVLENARRENDVLRGCLDAQARGRFDGGGRWAVGVGDGFDPRRKGLGARGDDEEDVGFVTGDVVDGEQVGKGRAHDSHLDRVHPGCPIDGEGRGGTKVEEREGRRAFFLTATSRGRPRIEVKVLVSSELCRDCVRGRPHHAIIALFPLGAFLAPRCGRVNWGQR